MAVERAVDPVVDGKILLVTGRLLKTARLRSELHVQLEHPASFVQEVKQSGLRADLVTFLQDLGDTAPKHSFYHEAEKIAVLPINTYDHWVTKQLYNKPRNMLRKALKSGIEIRVEEFSEPLVRGIKAIYDETPIRQGKRNYHYGEDLDRIRREHATFLDRSEFITVHFGGEMIGFAKVTYSQGCGVFMNFLSKVSHRDKAVNNAIVAKAVELCAARRAKCLVYGVWGSGGTRGLMEFKVANGFECVELPRYFVPLTVLGSLALKTGLHRGLARAIPAWAIEPAARLRKSWNTIRLRTA